MTDNKENDSWNVFFSDLAKFREVQERQKQRGLNDFTSLGSELWSIVVFKEFHQATF